MLETIATIVVGGIIAVSAAWVGQHVLGTSIGWLRAVVLVVIVYALTIPLVRAALAAGDVIRDGQFEVPNATGAVFIAIALGWQFALALTAIMISELFWPTGRGWHPIRGVRGMLRQRDRLRRYSQTLRIASKHGLSLYGRRRPGEEKDVPAALVASMNEAGVTFVKIGQVLSTRDDVLPVEFTQALATLQMRTTPLPWPQARAAIEAELAGTLEDAFSWVDETPLAAASVAQVHAARLHPTDGETEGRSVVIKIQRPAARESVQVDADIITRLTARAERRAVWAREYGLNALASEFVRSLQEELDYRIELGNTELMRHTLAISSVPTVHVPEVFPELCTSRMLVQEHVLGVAFSDLQGDMPRQTVDAAAHRHTRSEDFEVGEIAGRVDVTTEHSPPTARDVADTLVDSVFEQVAIRGVFHADLHPGNIILRPDGQLTFIDLGSIGLLERSLRRMLIALMSAMDAEDDIALTDLLLMVTGEPSESADVDAAALQHEIGVILTRLHAGRTDTAIFHEVIKVLREYRLSLPPALVLVFRTLASLEGTLRRLVPGYDMLGRALERTPHFARLAIRPDDAVAASRAQLQLLSEQMRRLPRRIENIGRQLENGTFGMSVRMFRDVRERNWVANIFGQLTTALIAVALLVVAVILVVGGGGPLLTPDVGLYPVLGSVLGLAGVVLVLRSLRTSLRRRGAKA